MGAPDDRFAPRSSVGPRRWDVPARGRTVNRSGARTLPNNMSNPRPRFTMVVLLVDDLPRSVAFYRRLGVEFPPDALWVF